MHSINYLHYLFYIFKNKINQIVSSVLQSVKNKVYKIKNFPIKKASSEALIFYNYLNIYFVIASLIALPSSFGTIIGNISIFSLGATGVCKSWFV